MYNDIEKQSTRKHTTKQSLNTLTKSTFLIPPSKKALRLKCGNKRTENAFCRFFLLNNNKIFKTLSLNKTN